MKKHVILLLALIFLLSLIVFLKKENLSVGDKKLIEEATNTLDIITFEDPLTIESLRKGNYPGSEIVVEQKIGEGINYKSYIVSYKSEGLKIYALLTVPTVDPTSGSGQTPKEKWPIIVFNHGYIPPREYQTTEHYVAYVDTFARNGYIVFKPDYRGHGDSEGKAAGGYGSNAYTIDVLNALASIRKYEFADPNRIGMWGHSMGGYITLRSLVVNKDIKAAVIWAGVVASYPDLLNNWRRRLFSPPPLPSGATSWRKSLTEKYGTPESNPAFWNSISANSYLEDVIAPVQLHHGTLDQSVPIGFSEKLEKQLKEKNKKVEYYSYEGDDHNISSNFNLAITRSVEFFDRYLK